MFSLASLVAFSALFVTSNVVADVLPSPVLLTRTTAAEVPNPVVTEFPAGTFLTMVAQSRAAFAQLVTITNVLNPPCIFRGTGENVPMLTTSPEPAGANNCVYSAGDSSLQLSFLFQFSESGNSGSFTNSRVQAPTVAVGVPVVDVITSEDDTDDDDNDTILTIAIFDPNAVATTTTTTSIPSPTAFPEALMSQGGLSVSNNGIDISIGPFAGSSTTSDFVVHTSAWSKITGRVIDHKTPGNWRNYLVMQFLLSGNTTPGMEKATMMMSAMVPYTDTRPTGNVSANWTTITGA